MKVCKQCKFLKPLSEFQRVKTCKDGISPLCVLCFRLKLAEASSRYRLKYPDRYLESIRKYEAKKVGGGSAERSRQWRIERGEPERAKSRLRAAEWKLKNPEKAKLLLKKFHESNPHKVSEYDMKRRVAQDTAQAKWSDMEFEELFLVEIYHLSKLRSELMGVKCQVDHIIPIQSKNVCGLHYSGNLQILTSSANQSKGNRYWPDMWLDSDFPQTLQ